MRAFRFVFLILVALVIIGAVILSVFGTFENAQMAFQHWRQERRTALVSPPPQPAASQQGQVPAPTNSFAPAAAATVTTASPALAPADSHAEIPLQTAESVTDAIRKSAQCALTIEVDARALERLPHQYFTDIESEPGDESWIMKPLEAGIRRADCPHSELSCEPVRIKKTVACGSVRNEIRLASDLQLPATALAVALKADKTAYPLILGQPVRVEAEYHGRINDRYLYRLHFP